VSSLPRSRSLQGALPGLPPATLSSSIS
jgi:hypothetical protein